MSIPIILSSLTYVNNDSDINYDILEFTDDGGLVIQHNQHVTVNTLITEKANKDAPQFVFTTVVPVKNQCHSALDEPDHEHSARLDIKALHGNLNIENIGAKGGNGGSGGDGEPGGNAPTGSANGWGGSGSSGGNGGNAGDGGDGPSVIINYPVTVQGEVNIKIKRSQGGTGGDGGRGGDGGKNADGTYAEPGKPGKKGQDGQPGEHGHVFVNGKWLNSEERR